MSLGARQETRADSDSPLEGLPDHAFHRNVDKIVLETGAKHAGSVNTALLCPPTIYGEYDEAFSAEQSTNSVTLKALAEDLSPAEVVKYTS